MKLSLALSMFLLLPGCASSELASGNKAMYSAYVPRPNHREWPERSYFHASTLTINGDTVSISDKPMYCEGGRLENAEASDTSYDYSGNIDRGVLGTAVVLHMVGCQHCGPERISGYISESLRKGFGVRRYPLKYLDQGKVSFGTVIYSHNRLDPSAICPKAGA